MARIKLNLDRGQTVLAGLLDRGVDHPHECGGRLACATCCVEVHHGPGDLSPVGEEERDVLERATPAGRALRLACQAVGTGAEIVIDLPDGDGDQRSVPLPGHGIAVALTERAGRHLAAQLGAQPGKAVLLAVEPVGCSGLRYRLALAEFIGEGHAVFESRGIRIVIDRKQLPFVQGATLDIVPEALNRRLKVHNPNARRICGCGESFAV